jgi:hypothetical protein
LVFFVTGFPYGNSEPVQASFREPAIFQAFSVRDQKKRDPRASLHTFSLASARSSTQLPLTSQGRLTMAKVDGPAIGIDLGTTYSCVGVWQHDRYVSSSRGFSPDREQTRGKKGVSNPPPRDRS